jgi:hypothetical protein
MYQSFLNIGTTIMTGLFYVPIIPGSLGPHVALILDSVSCSALIVELNLFVRLNNAA